MMILKHYNFEIHEFWIVVCSIFLHFIMIYRTIFVFLYSFMWCMGYASKQETRSVSMHTQVVATAFAVFLMELLAHWEKSGNS